MGLVVRRSATDRNVAANQRFSVGHAARGRRKRAQDAHQVGVLAQAVDRRGDRRIGRRALEVEEEHVLARARAAAAATRSG